MSALTAPGPPSSVEEILVRLLLALALGGLVGWERQYQGKDAGLRTHMLVALGAAMFTLAALVVAGDPQTRHVDATRVVQGIAAGIGFLGAGQILQARDSVHGVTTAAGIWVVGSVGVACGIGHYVLAAVGGLLVVAVLFGVGWLEQMAEKRARPERPPARRHLKAGSASRGSQGGPQVGGTAGG